MTDRPRAASPEDVRLPESAFRPLAPGERYEPVVPAAAAVPETTLRSLLQGALWAVVFSAAATYIALKLGQGIESAIPISILAVGFSALSVRVLARRASTLLENVNVLAIGATSGIVAGGSVFTMPAIHILGLESRSSFFQIFLVPLLGAILGVFLLAPFRRYFVRDLHGRLPYPEARATTEILVAGRRGGHSALVLTWSALFAAAFDFVGPSMRGWAENFSSGAISALAAFTERTKAVFTMNTSAAVFGLGYIMGLDYASIIMAGSMVSFFVLVPLFAWFGPQVAAAIPPGTQPLATLPAEEIFSLYVRPIGIGGIFAAGLLSILKMSPVILQATRQALGEVARLARGRAAATEGDRTDRGLPMSTVLLGIAATGLAILLYFRLSVLPAEPSATSLALASTALALVIAFLFAAVSAWAIAMISITPISGMTLTTLIVTAVALSALGLRGESGMLQVLLIGGVVCTALSMSGSLVTQYKIAYWLGATPRRIELSNLAGAVLASLATTAVILLMARVYGFAPSPAPPPPPSRTPWLRSSGASWATAPRRGSSTASAASSPPPRRCAGCRAWPSPWACTCPWSSTRHSSSGRRWPGSCGDPPRTTPSPRRGTRRERWWRPASSPEGRSWACSRRSSVSSRTRRAPASSPTSRRRRAWGPGSRRGATGQGSPSSSPSGSGCTATRGARHRRIGQDPTSPGGQA
jgi:putative OPT family oligopeptide transporter